MLVMAHKGNKFLALLLGLATVSPAPAVFAQVRVVPVESALPASRSFSGSILAAPSVSLSNGLTVAPVLAAPALAPAFAPAASAPAPAASPISAAAAPAAALAPAPAAAASVPAERPVFAAVRAALPAAAEGPKPVSGESAKTSVGASFDGAKAAAAENADPVAGRESLSASALRPASAQPSASIFDPGPRTASVPDQVRDQMRYQKMLSRSFWWYMFTHVKDMWPGYKSRWAKADAGGPVAVSSPRAFFTAMRVTGMSGRFYALGGSALEDDLVISEFRGAFARYFDGPGIGARERAALEAFMLRAKGFNAEKRAHTNMYKNIRDPLIKASSMKPEQLAPYFDSLIPPEKEITTKEYQQSGQMERTKEAFLSVLQATLDEEDRSDPHHVRAAIVLGSFASGSAGPGSDFDVEALVDGASDARLHEAADRSLDRGRLPQDEPRDRARSRGVAVVGGREHRADPALHRRLFRALPGRAPVAPGLRGSRRSSRARLYLPRPRQSPRSARHRRRRDDRLRRLRPARHQALFRALKLGVL
jgi:hypothetical protein